MKHVLQVHLQRGVACETNVLHVWIQFHGTLCAHNAHITVYDVTTWSWVLPYWWPSLCVLSKDLKSSLIQPKLHVTACCYWQTQQLCQLKMDNVCQWMQHAISITIDLEWYPLMWLSRSRVLLRRREHSSFLMISGSNIMHNFRTSTWVIAVTPSPQSVMQQDHLQNEQYLFCCQQWMKAESLTKFEVPSVCCFGIS